jgi:hypothetical protein
MGFVIAHSEHPQGSKGIFPSIHGKANIIQHEGWSGRGYVGRKDVKNLVPPTKNTLEKGKDKEEQGNWRNPSLERTAHKVGCRRITYVCYSAGTYRRYKSRKLEKNEEEIS